MPFQDSILPPHDTGFVTVMEIMLSVDRIVTDDSRFQVGLSEEEETFINFRTNIWKSDVPTYTTPINNEPLLVIYFGFQKSGMYHERVVYDLNAYFG